VQLMPTFQLRPKPFTAKRLKFRKKRRLSPGLALLTFVGSFAAILLIISFTVTPKVAIIGFHGIVDLNNPIAGASQTAAAQRISYPMQELEKLLDYLVRRNYWFLSAQDLHDYFILRSKKIPAEHIGQKPVMLTFDDSYKTVYTNVLPILDRLQTQYGHSAKMVLFVNPGTLAPPDRPSTQYLSCQDLRESYQTGFYDIQSHGQNHKNLVHLNAQDLVTELVQAQITLRTCLADLAPAETIAAHLAYPYGAMNDWVASIAAKYYHSAYLYNSRILRFCWLKDHYRISRFTANRDKPADWLIRMAARSIRLESETPCPK
jgi:poly-beta-1,6-N-acetyl-D-glucosamine N-deacetylase